MFDKILILFLKIMDNFLLKYVQVEKSLQRIHRGQKNAMYTTQKSIENKVSHLNY